jgi:hypothetical protein
LQHPVALGKPNICTHRSHLVTGRAKIYEASNVHWMIMPLQVQHQYEGGKFGGKTGKLSISCIN